MKSTGMVRSLDGLGRLVIPKKICQTMDLDTVEVFVDGEQVILRKYARGCVFCGEANGTIQFNGKNICPGCLGELKQNNQ